ncbi:MAG: VWA domain-containing protein [Bacteroidota bacterium]
MRSAFSNARRFTVLTVSFLLMALIFAGNLQAQPNLNFKRATVNWPTVELYFSVDCNGAQARNMTKQDFRILEDGVEVPDFTLWCPDTSIICGISVSLVFDASGSMMGAGNAGAKLGGHAFVDLMDGVVDEAAIIFFSDRVTMYQQMTTIKPMLHAAVDALPANGATAVWDGIYAGLVDLVNNGVNQCRAVIAMTDGGDNSSSRTVAEIIALANRHKINVFTIGLGTATNATELEQIALLTGGRYYQAPNAGQLGTIYPEIMQLIRKKNQECVITYERDCADGAMRTVELQLNNFCGGSDTETHIYFAPRDSTTFSQLQMELGDVWAVGGSQVAVPLNLLTPMNGENFYPFSFSVRYDTSCMKINSIAVPPGSLLDGLPLTVTPLPDGARISVMDRKAIQGTGKMLELLFLTPDVQDTTCCIVEIVDPVFAQGCFLPVVDPGNVCFYPPVDEAWNCAIVLPTITIDTVNESYSPMPFNIRVNATNIGGLPIDSLTAEISFQPDLAFVLPDNPARAIKPLSPSALNVGESGNASWTLSHPSTMTGRDYTIRVVVRTPSDSTVCQSLLHIPALLLPPFSFDVIPEGSITFCQGQSVTLDAGDGFTSYLWNNGATTRKITVNKSGDYFCTVKRSDGRTGVSNAIRVIVFSAPNPTLNVSGPIPFCESDSIRLTVPGPYVKYLWSTGDSTSSLLVTKGGVYWAIVHTADNCIGFTDTLMLSLFPTPPKPVISRSGDVLLSTVAGNYFWLRNGSMLPGENNQFLQLTETGSYRVRVTNEYGCISESDEILVTLLDVAGLPAVVRSFDVYPDPTVSGVTIDLRLESAELISVVVTNALGQELSRIDSGHPVQDFSRHITLGTAPGAYFLRITAGADAWVRRVVKMQ